MKLPRWLVIAMLTTSVLAVLVAAGWWWVTWPERTALDFKSFIAEGEYEKAMSLVSPPNGPIAGTARYYGPDLRSHVDKFLVSEYPSMVDLLIGRRHFQTQTPQIVITIKRSKILVATPEGKSWQFWIAGTNE